MLAFVAVELASCPKRGRACVLPLDVTSLYTMASADQWDAQATVKRINESLIERGGYVTWFDLTNMKGDTSALAAASAVFLSGIATDRP